MRFLAALLLAIMPSPLAAQVTYPPAAVDLSAVPSKADVQAASDAAAAAQALASAAQTAAASKCAATPSVPPMEVVGGVAGTSGVGCRPVNAVQPRITRSVSFTTGAGGTAVVTWADMGAVPLVFPLANVSASSTAYPKCAPVTGTITSTGATIKCTTPLVTIGILSVAVAPVDTAAVGVTGQVLAIPVS